MTTIEKITIHDIAWDIAEDPFPTSQAGLAFILSVAGILVSDESLAYLKRRVRIERAKRGVFAEASQ